MLLLTSLLLTIFYVGIMLTFKVKWEEISESMELPSTVSTYVSVIIPARNEDENITAIISDILLQDYPHALMEIIVIDDHSDDNTFNIVADIASINSIVKIYKLAELLPASLSTEAYKKQAIEYAVRLSKGELIITTDADCRAGKNWLRSVVGAYEKEHCSLIASPVCFHHDTNVFQKFQALDFCGMQAITAASLRLKMFNMANGANLAYEKKAFLAVNGYRDIDQKASGDDMLLVYKIATQFPGSILFLKNKNAIVYTKPAKTISEFLQQRFRWTSKSGSYQDKRISLILGLVYLFVVSIWVNFIYSVVSLFMSWNDHSGFKNESILLIFLIQLSTKSIIDYFFLQSASSFFDRKDLMKTFIASELLHTWYIPFVGTLGNILSYNWKGRKLK